MSKLTVDFIKAADKTAVKGVLTRAFKKDAPLFTDIPDQALSREPERPTTFVARLDDEIVGTVSCTQSKMAKMWRFGFIIGLAVDPARQEKGIGHALMKRAEEFIANDLLGGREGMVVLEDGTKRWNPQSRFYENLGYGPEREPAIFPKKDALYDIPIFVKYVNPRPPKP